MALSIANSEPEIPSIKTITQIEQQLETKEPKFEDISAPLVKAGKKRQKAEEARKKALEPKPVIYTPTATYTPYIAPQKPVAQGTLTGSVGYSIPYGNCVNQVPISIRPNGSPYQWLATTQTPYIGAVALFTWNHTGIVTGIWSNGDLEIRHENAGGMGHRVPRSMLRGFR